MKGEVMMAGVRWSYGELGVMVMMGSVGDGELGVMVMMGSVGDGDNGECE